MSGNPAASGAGARQHNVARFERDTESGNGVGQPHDDALGADGRGHALEHRGQRGAVRQARQFATRRGQRRQELNIIQGNGTDVQIYVSMIATERSNVTKAARTFHFLINQPMPRSGGEVIWR